MHQHWSILLILLKEESENTQVGENKFLEHCRYILSLLYFLNLINTTGIYFKFGLVKLAPKNAQVAYLQLHLENPGFFQDQEFN